MNATRAGRFLVLTVAVAGLLWLFGPQAHANGLEYLGLYFLAIGLAIILAKVAVEVTVEAVVYRYGLPMPWGRAWLSALVATVSATIVGVVVASGLALAWADDRWGYLAVPLLIALLVEIGLVWALNPSARRGWRLPAVVALANVGSWSLFLGLAWVVSTATDGFGGIW